MIKRTIKKISIFIWILSAILWVDLYFNNGMMKYNTVRYIKFGTWEEVYFMGDEKIYLSDLGDSIKNEIYGEKLPHIDIKWNDLRKYEASGVYVSGKYEDTIFRIIYLDDKVRNRSYVDLRNIIAHEMIHYYLDYNDIYDQENGIPGHGVRFILEMILINYNHDYNIGIYDVYNYKDE